MTAATILTVCTGNICRSPHAERLLTASIHRLGLDHITVASAGTDALHGEPMTPEMAARTTARGADPDGHAATQLTAGTIRSADLLLALARDHRRAIVELVPAAAPRAYTLTEFARLADNARTEGLLDGIAAGGTTDRTLTDFIDAVWARRGFAPPPDDPEEDDVIDPYRRSAEVYDDADARIADAVARIETALTVALAGVRA